MSTPIPTLAPRDAAASEAGVIRLSEVIAALSYALDITEGQPQGHAARTCLIGMRLAQQIGLSTHDQSSLFYALLLKDLGCSSNAAKMCYLFGADDRQVKHDVKTIDWSKTSANFHFVRDHVAPEGSGLEKLLKLVSIALQGPQGPKKLIQTRCERGASIARQLGFTEDTALAIHQLDEHWDGKGHPDGLKGAEISLLARIMGLAQTLEVFFSLQGLTAAIDIANERRGRWFDPALVDAFLAVCDDADFWRMVCRPEPHKQVSRYEPADEVRIADENQLDSVAAAFASVVDAKSPWTYKHSSGVADIAVGIAEILGHSPQELRSIHRMGLLHDVGKLGVSNLILDKPGKLDDAEFAALKEHTFHTQIIVGRVESLTELAHQAAAHHEKLNGRGYHRGIASGELPISARLLAVADIFEALSAARPYRDGMPLEKILGILDKEAGTTLCAESCLALLTWLDRREFEARVDAQLQAVENLVAEL
jgi:HD-GYP domain-containing protein (c-di-GMP phosphodiesterase class II)